MFCWYQLVMVDEEIYCVLYNEYWLIVDVVCFFGCYINYLTLRTLDIDWVQLMMFECGIEFKIFIEGLLCREVLILLRQISFKVLEEMVLFVGQKQGMYIVCFGEIEQCGVVLMLKG